MADEAGLAAYICVRKYFFKKTWQVFANTNSGCIFVSPKGIHPAGKQNKKNAIKNEFLRRAGIN